MIPHAKLRVKKINVLPQKENLTRNLSNEYYKKEFPKMIVPFRLLISVEFKANLSHGSEKSFTSPAFVFHP